MTNVLDGPIYMGLFGTGLLLRKLSLNRILVAGAAFTLTVLPFVLSFKSFVTGVAVNCPPEFLAERKIGPLLFETVDKCQKSPLWMLLILWGFFVYCGIKLWREKENSLYLLISVVCLGLIIFPEFFYFKDIYPQHFRSNTMFKLGYQAFIMMSLISGYVITKALVKPKLNKLFLAGLMPLIIFVCIYPLFSVRSYFGGLKTYQGIYGLEWLTERYPGNTAVIDWFSKNIKRGDQPVIVEANGDSYTDYNSISTFTGLPTIAGWTVHEWLWRGGYDPIAARGSEVASIYESPDIELTKTILNKYQVKYIIVGPQERQKYVRLDEEKIDKIGKKVFSFEESNIFEVGN
jgi:uncharacterized membrane protein